MKEITEELQKRNAVVCVSCGSIYVGATKAEMRQPCPNCSEVGDGLYWITGIRIWIQYAHTVGR